MPCADKKGAMHIQPNSGNAALRKGSLASAAECLRLLAAFLCGVFLLTAACYAQAPPDTLKIVHDASYNELRASNHGHPFRYRLHAVDDGKATVKETVETRDGDISRLVERDGKPLDDAANQQELARLDKLNANPDEQASRHKKSQANNDRDNEMVKLLPDAFLYTFLGMVPGPNGPAYRFQFKPNPAFQPPDRQGEVYHGMAGELWVDEGQQRMVRFDAHLISDVNFGWGIVGRLFQGGTILVEQRDVGDHHWETTHMRLNLTGKILMVKSLRIDTTEDSTDFRPVPDAGYQAAIALLKSMPAEEGK